MAIAKSHVLHRTGFRHVEPMLWVTPTNGKTIRSIGWKEVGLCESDRCRLLKRGVATTTTTTDTDQLHDDWIAAVIQ